MTEFEPPTGEGPLDRDLAEVRKLLRGVRGALSALRDRLERDQGGAVAGTGKALSELRQLIRTAIDTEKSFEQRQKDRQGIAEDYRLDLEQARATIGERLARLRAAGDPEGVS
ncbi:hypothetical protein [Shimia sp.]|uniref:hypothetical protein n=1 Tax=Shimia sp. TaxID=1954381 RepID=UPI00356526BD